MEAVNEYIIFLIKMVGAMLIVTPFILSFISVVFKRYYEAKARYNLEIVRVMSRSLIEGLKAVPLASQKKQA